MLLRILSAEFLKIRRKWLWLLVAAGPLGVVALQAVNFGVRYDYLVAGKPAEVVWNSLIGDVALLALPAMLMGLAIVASMTAGIEHQMNAWKLTLALPVSKRQVFAGKFLLTVLLLLVACALLVPLTAGLGSMLGFSGPVPWGHLAAAAFYPFLAAMPFVALQTWLSVTMANQALPLTIGIVGMIVTLFAGIRLPDWVPYKWPQLAGGSDDPLYAVAAGLGLGIVVFAVGLTEFVRKDAR